MLTSTCLTFIEAFWDWCLLHCNIAARVGRDPMLAAEYEINRREQARTVRRAEFQQPAIANIREDMHIVDEQLQWIIQPRHES